MSFRFILAFFLAAWTSTAFSLDATDQGLYNVMHRGGYTTDMTFMATIIQGRWHMYRQMQNHAWEDVTCEGDCNLVESSTADMSRFFRAEDVKEITLTCVHNKAFAFCKYIKRVGPEVPGYVFVVLEGSRTTHINLGRVK